MTEIEILSLVRLGMTRSNVKAVLGEPSDYTYNRKKGSIGIYKYENIELHFNDTGHLFMVYKEDSDFNPHVLLK